MPERLRQVGGGAFAYCRKLEDVIITNKWVEIGESSFYDCPALKNVFYAGTKEYWDSLKVDILNQDLLEANIHFESETHIPSEWITDTTATVYKSGTKHKECTVCGIELETAIIKQLKCSKPKLKSIENTEYGVLIKWGSVKGADSYAVYRKTGSNGKYSKIATTSKTYYTDKKASSGKKYYYYVKAVNEAGSSSASSSLSKYYLEDTTLSTPKSTKSGITLKWKKVTGAEGYKVYRKSGSGSYKQIGTTSKTSYTDTTAKSGTTYTYTAKAYKSKTDSSYNSTGLKLKYLAAPKAKTTVYTSSISVSWSKVSGAKEYTVYRKASGESEYKKIATTTKTAYKDTNVKNNKTYSYRVRAINGKTTSAYRTIKQLFLSVPKLSSVKNDQFSVEFKWAKVSGAEKYRVYRKTEDAKKYTRIATVGEAVSTYVDKSSKKDGETYMDIYIHADCVGRGNLHTDFSRDM